LNIIPVEKDTKETDKEGVSSFKKKDAKAFVFSESNEKGFNMPPVKISLNNETCIESDKTVSDINHLNNTQSEFYSVGKMTESNTFFDFGGNKSSGQKKQHNIRGVNNSELNSTEASLARPSQFLTINENSRNISKEDLELENCLMNSFNTSKCEYQQFEQEIEGTPLDKGGDMSNFKDLFI